jgi:hypothetical protein
MSGRIAAPVSPVVSSTGAGFIIFRPDSEAVSKPAAVSVNLQCNIKMPSFYPTNPEIPCC